MNVLTGRRLRSWLRPAALASLLLSSMTAQAELRTYLITYSGAPFGNSATVSATITLDDTKLPNPGGDGTRLVSAADLGVTLFDVTVAGANAGNGAFDLGDIGFFRWNTNGATYDLGQDLAPQIFAAGGTFNMLGGVGALTESSGAATGNTTIRTNAFASPTGNLLALSSFEPVGAGPTETFDLVYSGLPNGNRAVMFLTLEVREGFLPNPGSTGGLVSTRDVGGSLLARVFGSRGSDGVHEVGIFRWDTGGATIDFGADVAPQLASDGSANFNIVGPVGGPTENGRLRVNLEAFTSGASGAERLDLVSFRRSTTLLDSDGDGVNDGVDRFPMDPTEVSDLDGDGLGDNSDPDPLVSNDRDGDGVPNDVDAFPDDPAESADRDGDGVGDNGDAFPDDPTETTDTDGDGVGDVGDAFPEDPSETRDSDGDGFGDVADAFPDDPDEFFDADLDGIGDNADDLVDTDRDGVGDLVDNCLIVPNADQADGDGNGFGDACDLTFGEAVVDASWRPVAFPYALTAPVVVPSLSRAPLGREQQVQIRNVTPTGFEIRLRATSASVADLPGRYGWIAGEAGQTHYGERRIAVGRAASVPDAGLGPCGSTFTQIDFGAPLSAPPVVLLAPQTTDNDFFRVVRMCEGTASGARIGLQREEAAVGSPGSFAEVVGWIAWDPRPGAGAGRVVDTLQFGLDHNAQDRRFARAEIEGLPFDEPRVFGQVQTFTGTDSAQLRLDALPGAATARLSVAEDVTLDSEIGHAGETVGVLVIAEPRPLDAPRTVIDWRAGRGTDSRSTSVDGTLAVDDGALCSVCFDDATLVTNLGGGSRTQSVIRFPDLPGNLAILRARLELWQSSNLAQGAPIAVHTLERDWSVGDGVGSAPWAGGATPGIDTDDNEAAIVRDATSTLQADPASKLHRPVSDGALVFDVTESVRVWQNRNNGLLLTPVASTDAPGNDLAGGSPLSIWSSEYGDPTLRPRLVVETCDLGAIAGSVTFDADADGLGDRVDPFPCAADADGDGADDAAELARGVFGDEATIDGAPSVGEAVEVHLEDLDADGQDDLLVVGTEGIVWYPVERVQGPRGAEPVLTFGAARTIRALRIRAHAVFDADGDGDVDIAYGSDVEKQFSVLRNDGTGSFTESVVSGFCGSGNGCDLPRAVVPFRFMDFEAVDFDGDDDVDLLASFGTESLLWFENDGRGDFVFRRGPEEPSVFGGNVNNVLVPRLDSADVDFDGRPDVLAYNRSVSRWFGNVHDGDNTDGDKAVIGTNGSVSAPVRDPLEIRFVELFEGRLTAGRPYKFDAVVLERDSARAWFNRSGDSADPSRFDFAFPLELSFEAGMRAFELEDLDGNSEPDFVSAGDRIVWQPRLKGLIDPLRFEVLSERPSDELAVGDLDGDGDLDIVALGETLFWLQNVSPSDPRRADSDGDGLSDGAEFEVGRDPRSPDDLRVDSDGDGLDLAAEVRAGSSPDLPDTDGDGLDDAVEVAAGTAPDRADSDGDTLFDSFELAGGLDPLVADDPASDTDGDGLSHAEEQRVSELPCTLNARCLNPNGSAGDDFDGDGLTDFEEIRRVYWTEPRLLPGTDARLTGDVRVSFADIDGDGRDDVVATLPTLDRVVWYRNTPEGLVGPQLIAAGQSAGPIRHATGDVDGDEDVDVIVLSSVNGWVSLFENQLTQLGEVAFADRQFVDIYDSFSGIDLADIDRDGDLDLLVAGRSLFDSDTVASVFYYENGVAFGNPFGVPQKLVASTGRLGAATQLTAVDVDVDGRLEILVSTGSGREVVAVDPGGFPLTFGVTTLLNVNSDVDGFEVADLNGDASPDLVVTGGSTLFYPSDAPGSFPGGSSLSFLAGGAPFAVADVDRDGSSDIVVASSQSQWLRNTDGKASFRSGSGTQVLPPAGTQLAGVVATSLDDVEGPEVLTIARLGEGIRLTASRFSDVLDEDTDDDGLVDGDERAAGTEVFSPDTDGDGLLDGFEVAFGLDPLCAGEPALDADRPACDGAVADAVSDEDGDGLTALQEQALGTRPNDANSDGVQLTDAQCAALGRLPGCVLDDGEEVDRAARALGLACSFRLGTCDPGVLDATVLSTLGTRATTACDFDDAAPTTLAIPSGAGATRQLALSCSDAASASFPAKAEFSACGTAPAASGCFETLASLNGGPLLETDRLDVGPTDQVSFRSEDAAGNVEPLTRLVGGVFTRLSFDLTAKAVLQDDLRAAGFQLQGTGSLTAPGSNLSPAGATVSLTILDEDGSPIPQPLDCDPDDDPLTPPPLAADVDSATVRDVTVAEDGTVRFDDICGFTAPGTYRLDLEFDGTALLKDASAPPLALLVGSRAGYAVIVQGKVPNEEGIDAHAKTTNRIYDTLRARGFEHQDIYYFGYDETVPLKSSIPESEFNDFDRLREGPPTKEAIRELLCGASCADDGAGEASEARGTLARDLAGSPAPLVVAMIDHGLAEEIAPDVFEGRFVLGDTSPQRSITSTEFAAWIDDLERDALAELGAGATTEDLDPRLLMFGYCYSGSFVEPLASPGRIVLASATEAEESYQGIVEEDGVRVGEFFVEELFLELGQGEDLRTAFERATERTETFTRRSAAAFGAAPFFDGAAQHPILEDDGLAIPLGRFGSNSLVEGGDGVLAADFVLGVGVGTNSALDPARIVRVFPRESFLTSDRAATRAVLQIETNGEEVGEEVVRVPVLEVREPGVALPPSDPRRGVTQQREISNAVSRRFLVRDTPTSFVYFADLDLFDTAGMYEIFFQVTDAETGLASPTERAVVYKNFSGNAPPRAFRMLSPLEEPDGLPEVSALAATFEWERSVDPVEPGCPAASFCAEEVTYQLEVATESTFLPATIVATRRELRTPFATLTERDGLEPSTIYYWRVTAVDGFGSRTRASNRDEGVFVTKGSTNEFVAADLILRQRPVAAVVNDTERAGYSLDVENAVEIVADGTANPNGFDADDVRLIWSPNQPVTEVSATGCTNVPAYDAESGQIECELGLLPYSAVDEGVRSRAVSLLVRASREGVLALPVRVAHRDTDANPQSDEVTSDEFTAVQVIDPDADPDRDGDDVPNQFDNCPDTPNNPEDNLDGDAFGDACDDDIDGDGLSNAEEEGNALLDPRDPGDAGADFDTDGFSNLAEVRAGTRITDSDDFPGAAGDLEFGASLVAVGEEDGSARLVVRRLHSLRGPVEVRVRTMAGPTAAPGADFAAVDVTLAWADGEGGAREVSIPIVQDGAVEGTEHFVATLVDATSSVRVLSADAVVAIHDDDADAALIGAPAGVLSVATQGVQASEGETVGVIVDRTGSAAGAVSVRYALVERVPERPGDARPARIGEDLWDAVGELAWAAGDASPRTVPIMTLADGVPETTEEVEFVLFEPSGGALLGDAHAIVEIDDADARHAAGIVKATRAELFAPEPGGRVRLTLVRDGGTSGTITVAVRSEDGEAVAGVAPGGDYDAPGAREVSWADGELEPREVVIDLRVDAVAEYAERFALSVEPVLGGVRVDAQARRVEATILDDSARTAGPLSFLTPDDDRDGMSDAYELAHGLAPDDASDAQSDGDHDGIGALAEAAASTHADRWLSVPAQNGGGVFADADGDAISDAGDADDDGDGISDAVEFLLANHAADADDDGDRYTNRDERAAGSDPNDPTSRPVDCRIVENESGPFRLSDRLNPDDDGDGLLDAEENDPILDPGDALDPCDPTDADGDADGDEITNLQEIRAGTDPFDGTDTPDLDAPHVTCLDLTVEATSAAGAACPQASASCSALDAQDGALDVPQPVGLTQCALGETATTVVVRDSAGNEDRTDWRIEVVDTTAPVLTAPTRLVIETEAAGVASNDPVVVAWRNRCVAEDAVDGDRPCTTPGLPSSLPLGLTEVLFRSEDSRGNRAEANGEILIVPPQPVQRVTGRMDRPRVVPGGEFTVRARYETLPLPAQTTGISVTMHFDSSRLTFVDRRVLLPAPIVTASSAPEPDVQDLDSNPATDVLLRFALVDGGGAWPSVPEGSTIADVLPGDLFEVTLRAAPDFPVAEGTMIGFAGEAAAGYVFSGRALPVLAGGLYDVDGDGRVTALTDGLMILRYLFSFRGEALVSAAACRPLIDVPCSGSAAEVEARLQALRDGGDLNVDGSTANDGAPGALTDGLLILRRLFGFGGDTLTAGAVRPDCTRCDAAAVEAFLDARSNVAP